MIVCFQAAWAAGNLKPEKAVQGRAPVLFRFGRCRYGHFVLDGINGGLHAAGEFELAQDVLHINFYRRSRVPAGSFENAGCPNH